MLFYIHHLGFHHLEGEPLKKYLPKIPQRRLLRTEGEYDVKNLEFLLSEAYQLGHISRGKKGEIFWYQDGFHEITLKGTFWLLYFVILSI